MKTKKNVSKYKKLLVIISFFIFSLVSVSPVSAQGLVPCGSGSGYENRCTLCHLIVGIHGILTWGMEIMVFVALFGMTLAGVMYIISMGDQKMMERAKTFIIQIAIGIAIVLGAWMIVNVIMNVLSANLGVVGVSSWYEFNCDTPSSSTSSSSSASSSSTSSSSASSSSTSSSSASASSFPTSSSSNYDPVKEAEVRKRLADAGVKINRENACTSSTETGCTSVAGLREETIQGIIDLKKACDAASKEPCDVIVNSGSEEGSHGPSKGTGRAHGEGRKVDYEATTSLSEYIESHSTRQDSSDFNEYTDEATYIDNKGTHYVVENGSVWDSCYNCTY